MTEIPKRRKQIQCTKLLLAKNDLKILASHFFLKLVLEREKKEKIDSGESCDYSICSHLINFMCCINHDSLTFIEEPMVWSCGLGDSSHGDKCCYLFGARLNTVCSDLIQEGLKRTKKKILVAQGVRMGKSTGLAWKTVVLGYHIKCCQVNVGIFRLCFFSLSVCGIASEVLNSRHIKRLMFILFYSLYLCMLISARKKKVHF